MTWVASHGGREVIRADHLAAATEAAAAALTDATGDNGVIELTTTIRVVVANN
jgi:hypothetical protein